MDWYLIVSIPDFCTLTYFYLNYNRINGLVGVWNEKAEQPAWTRVANRANTRLVLHVRLMCGSPSITTPVSLLTNESDVRSVHGQVSLAVVNQMLCNSWGYERLQKSKDSLKDCFENVNIVIANMLVIISHYKKIGNSINVLRLLHAWWSTQSQLANLLCFV